MPARLAFDTLKEFVPNDESDTIACPPRARQGCLMGMRFHVQLFPGIAHEETRPKSCHPKKV